MHALAQPVATPNEVPSLEVFKAKWDRFQGAVDQSDLNQPLSRKDRVAVSGAHFVKVGPDGKVGTADDERVKLFGINLSHHAAFPPIEKAKDMAATLRSLGFNAVRLHHLDTLPTDDPNEYRSTLTRGPYPSLHLGAVRRLKAFLIALRREGIYVNLNLMVGYEFRPSEDQVPALDAAGTPPRFGSPVHVFHPRLKTLQMAYASALLKALDLGSDPVLAQVEISNEASVAASWFHWNANQWEQDIRGEYADVLYQLWRQWVEDRYGNTDKACAAWRLSAGCEAATQHPTPTSLEPVLPKAVQGWWAQVQAWWQQLLNAWLRWWQGENAPIPATEASGPKSGITPLHRDALLFIADLDRRFMNDMRNLVRSQTRSDLPVTGSQVNFLGPLNLWSHRDMDYVDVHHYTDTPEFPGGSWSDTHWRIQNISLSGKGLNDGLSLSFYRDFNRPFVLSEFNQPYPNTSGQDIVPLMTALAATQDWDGLYFFDYVDHQFARSTPHNFNLQGDWAKTAFMGLSAQLFRTDIIPPNAPVKSWSLTDQAVVAAGKLRRNDAWDLHVPATYGVRPEDALQAQLGHVFQGAKPPAAHKTTRSSPAAAPSLFQHPQFKPGLALQTPSAVALLGTVPEGAQGVQQGPVDVKWSTGALPKDTPLSLMVVSLDASPLPKAEQLVLSMPTQLLGSKPNTLPNEPQRLIPYPLDGGGWTLEPDTTMGVHLPALSAASDTDSAPTTPTETTAISGSRTAQTPLWMARMPWTLTLATKAQRVVVYPLDPNGRRLPPLPATHVRKVAQGWEVDLHAPGTPLALWYEWALKFHTP